MFRIGVDVGGTNTDSVLIDIARSRESNRGVLSFHKAPTTLNVSDGIEAAVRSVLEASGVAPDRISCLSIGTTAFINAVLEADARRLARVAVIRLCGPYTRQCPPFIDFPNCLRVLMQGYVAYIDGGLEIDGREIAPLNEQQLVEECKIIKEKGIRNVVLSGIFSPLDSSGKQEIVARDTVYRELGSTVNVVCSRDVGQLGLLERENASILNASILTFARRTIRGFQQAMHRLGLRCPLFLTQNDGTLTCAASAARLPIRTFASGPTNSMRGAAFLAGLDEGKRQFDGKSVIVVDVGGTTTDVGVLLSSGFPRQSAAFIEIAGVRTNFSMADVQSIGLGGGSRVRTTSTPSGMRATVGPDSVGHNITNDALVFGGNILTATDIVIANGRVKLGDTEKVSRLDSSIVSSAEAAVKKHLERIIDKMKTSPEDITVLLVGGGSIIAPAKLSGVREIIRPPFFSVANAVGAAMAKVPVAGEVDTIEFLEFRSLSSVVEDIKEIAIRKAIASGADPTTIKIVEVTNLPVQYVTNQATRIIVKSAGELAPDARVFSNEEDPDSDVLLPASGEEVDPGREEYGHPDDIEGSGIDIDSYKPDIRADRSWYISETDLEWIADGCGVLGTGGGGSPYPPFLIARQMLREGKHIIVIDADDVPEDAVFVRCTFMGSPSVSNERLQGGNEIPTSIQAVLRYQGLGDFAGTISDEIGGGNGIQPMIVAAEMGKPVLDADLMGRAYPNMYQSLPGAYNIPNGLAPCAISDGIGNTIIMPSASNSHSVEHILRIVTTEMGSKSGVSMAPLSRKACQEYGIARSVSQAWRIGRALALCRKRNDMKGIPSAILEIQNGSCLFIGKIVDVHREVRKGFTWGRVTIAPLREDEEEDNSASSQASAPQYGPEDHLVIPFQNENLYAYIESPSIVERKVLVTVPDLITVLDSQSGTALGTPEYRYGLRVTVIALAGDPKWTKTPEGLACGGPTAFGLNDLAFTPMAEYTNAESVITQYAAC
ncbi:unnamed protein product [Somion occarium]|uniref:Hydantoinase n=1 Tax=Somion occarium TaxID=3059160 RepID=A0ABP1DPQ4_9APHY